MSGSKTQSPQGAQKPKIEYRNRKIHWLIRWAGYATNIFMGGVFLGIITGKWFGLTITNEQVINTFMTLYAVAVFVNMGCWKLADSITSDEGFE